MASLAMWNACARERRWANILSDLAASEEHWRRQKDRHLEDLLREGYQGILGREPDEDGVRSHVERLRSGAALGEVLSDLAVSEEHWRQQKDRHLEELLREGYQGILGREPDEDSVRSHVERLRSGAALGEILSDLAASEEHWRQQKDRHA